MEEITEQLEQIAKSINANSIPLWLGIIGIIFPIIISIFVIIQTCIQHKQNTIIQKRICDMEIKAQMHNNFIGIYNDFCVAQNTIGKVSQNLLEVLPFPALADQWATELFESGNKVCQAVNRARLLLSDSKKEFREIVEKIFADYQILIGVTSKYLQSGTAEMNRAHAWTSIVSTYKIVYGDYFTLWNNPNAHRDFVTLNMCKEIKEIENDISKLMTSFKYDNFDVYFEEYVRMSKLEDGKHD